MKTVYVQIFVDSSTIFSAHLRTVFYLMKRLSPSVTTSMPGASSKKSSDPNSTIPNLTKTLKDTAKKERMFILFSLFITFTVVFFVRNSSQTLEKLRRYVIEYCLE